MAKIQLQKKYIATINSINRKKDDEIEQLKKDFSKKLNYYKEMVIKVTSKPLTEIKKYQEDTLETAIQ